MRVIFGPQKSPGADYAVLIRGGQIAWVGPDAQAVDPKGAKVLDETGSSVLPGLVTLHEHLFTTSPAPQPLLQQQGLSFPEMYLASGVTTIRTAGSVEPCMDLETKREIDAGEYPRPRMFLTAPYLDGIPPAYPQMHGLAEFEDMERGRPWNLVMSEGEFMSDRSWMDYMTFRAGLAEYPFPPMLRKEQAWSGYADDPYSKLLSMESNRGGCLLTCQELNDSPT